MMLEKLGCQPWKGQASRKRERNNTRVYVPFLVVRRKPPHFWNSRWKIKLYNCLNWTVFSSRQTKMPKLLPLRSPMFVWNLFLCFEDNKRISLVLYSTSQCTGYTDIVKLWLIMRMLMQQSNKVNMLQVYLIDVEKLLWWFYAWLIYIVNVNNLGVHY